MATTDVLFQVIRTRLNDPLPNQVVEYQMYVTERAAEAAAEILRRLPSVHSGREKVRIVRHTY